MRTGNWGIEELKRELNSRPEVKGWIIQRETLERRERYFLQENKGLAADQDREVQNLSIDVRVFVKKETPARQGEIRKKFFPAFSLKEQVDSAIESARQTDVQAWELPTEIPKSIPELKTADPEIAEDINGAMDRITDQIRKILNEKRESVFNSAEVFVSVHHRELHLSNGLTHRNSQTRIYAESAFSYSKPSPNGKTLSDEYMTSTWSVGVADLSLEKLFNEASENAMHSLDVEKPKGGRYPVILHADVLSTLFNGQLSHLSAFNSYTGLPFKRPGDELIPNAAGDLLSITADPTLEYGARTVALSSQGMIQSPLPLVRENKVLSTLAEKQYAQYLGIQPGTSIGNVVIEPGSLEYEDMIRKEPIVLEILQFSGLFADPNSGTFSSEIRLARLYDNRTGKSRYLKGGSLSGSITENFKRAYLSKERVKHSYFEAGNDDYTQGYFGPKYALLYDVSIAGT